MQKQNRWTSIRLKNCLVGDSRPNYIPEHVEEQDFSVIEFLFFKLPSSDSARCSDLLQETGYILDCAREVTGYCVYKCIVCSVDPLGKGDLDKHCREKKHVDRIGRIRKAQKQWKATINESVAARISFLPEKRRRLVYEQVGRQLFDSPGTFRANSIVDEVLPRCEQQERLTILELVVWKAMCLAEIPETVKGYHVFEWLKNGWKDSKESQRSSRSIATIMSLVVPFLVDTCAEL